MKKLLALVLAVVMMLGVASVASAETSLDAVKTAGVLKVGVDAAFAPMTFKDENGAYTGYDVALATAVAEKLGVAVEFVEVDWANLAAALNDGSIDVVWSGMSINAERQAAMTISEAYLESNTILMVHKDVAGFIEDLKGKKVSVQSGSYAEELLCEEYSELSAEMEILGAVDNDAAIADLIAGNVDAVMLDSVYAAYQIAANEALADYILIEDLYADLFGIAAAKGNYMLIGAIEEAISDLAAEGTIAAIDAEWFGADVCLIK